MCLRAPNPTGELKPLAIPTNWICGGEWETAEWKRLGLEKEQTGEDSQAMEMEKGRRYGI